MAETEVESILREIRERVISQQRAGHDAAGGAAQLSAGNGAGDSEASAGIVLPEGGGIRGADNLALVRSQLAITARAWDRLPPVVSNRSGLTARLELWVKRLLKRATHWSTWEQVNFNAAVHHALRDLLPVLAAQEQELGRLRAELAAVEERQRSELEQNRVELGAQLAAILAELRAAIAGQMDSVEARFATLASESRERDQQSLDELRVCFKQLALGASEAAVLEDRARRKTETLLEEIKQRVELLEK
jgi:hypothetical protein